MNTLTALRVIRREASQMNAVRNRMGFAGAKVFAVMELIGRITREAESRRQFRFPDGLRDRRSVRVVEQALVHFIPSRSLPRRHNEEALSGDL